MRTDLLSVDTLRPVVLQKLPNWIDNIILAGYRGSVAHGLYQEDTSKDVDVFCIFVHSKTYYLGLEGFLDRQTHFNTNGEDLDINCDDLRKFLHECARGNPNAHALLWIEPAQYWQISRAGEILLSSRDSLISRKIIENILAHGRSTQRKMNVFSGFDQPGTEEVISFVENISVNLKKDIIHTLRLLFTAEHLLQTREYRPRVTDEQAALLFRIEQGNSVSGAEINRMIDSLINKVTAGLNKCRLPVEYDIEEVNNLLLKVLDVAWRQHGKA